MLRELLSDVDKTIIEKYVNTYAFKETSSGRKMQCSVDELLRFWDNAKSESLYSLLGENLIVSKEVTFEIGISEMSDIIEEKIDASSNQDAWGKFIEEFYSKLIYCHSGDYVYSLRNLIYSESLAKNVYEGSTFSLPTPDGKEIKVQTGCTITRVLGKIAKAFNLEGWEEFRIAHSMVLNQRKVSGTLNLSIHPLDYMTMSDNSNNWSSCMSWIDDGCYRQGTVEMMNSPVVVVAYLSGHQDMYMPGGYDWNSKKWRELFIVSKDIITNVKSYPYKNDNLTKTALTWLKELADKAELGDYTDEYYSWNGPDENPEDTKEFFAKHELDIRTWTKKMYNDFGSHCGQLSYFRKDIQGKVDICYSGETQCMCCGEEADDLDNEGLLVCCDCEPVFRCEECDSIIVGEAYEVDGVYICEDCRDRFTFEDSITEETHLTNSLQKIYVAIPDNTTLPYGERFVDEGKNIVDLDLLSNWESFKIFSNWEGDYEKEGKILSTIGKFHLCSSGWDDKYYIYIDELTDRAAQILEYEDAADIADRYMSKNS